MVARLVLPTEVIQVKNPPVLLYGQPGVGKTSLAQTASRPLTLDFDKGIHRSAFRQFALTFDAWDEVVDAQQNGIKENGTTILPPKFGGYDTIVTDTIGSLLTAMSVSLIAGNSKYGQKSGGLTIQGYGALKGLFENWLTGLRQMGKQVIMIAHQKEEKEGDNKIMRPDITGGSYGIVMNCADVVGYMMYRNNQRAIYWEPTDEYFAKNGARLKSGPMPNFAQVPTYMEQLLTQARANLGSTSEMSAKLANEVAAWEAKLNHEDVNCAILNKIMTEEFIPIGAGPLKTQVWDLFKKVEAKFGLTWNKDTRQFTQPVEGGAA